MDPVVSHYFNAGAHPTGRALGPSGESCFRCAMWRPPLACVHSPPPQEVRGQWRACTLFIPVRKTP